MSEEKKPRPVGSIAINATEAAREIGVSRRTFIDILQRGELKGRKCGHLTLIEVEDLKAYIKSLPDATYATPKKREPRASRQSGRPTTA